MSKQERMRRSAERECRQWTKNLRTIILMEFVLITLEGARVVLSPLIRGYQAFGGESVALIALMLLVAYRVKTKKESTTE